MKKQTDSVQEMQKIAKILSSKLQGGDILALQGDLGAGKTTFTQGLAKALGIKANVTSPTFVLLKIYPTKHPTIKQLVHIDAYRLTTATDLEAIGWEDYLRADTLVVVEWADKIRKALPRSTKWIKFKLLANERHQVECKF